MIDAGIDVRATTPGTATIRAPPLGSRTTFTIPSSGRTWDAIVEIKADDATIQGFVVDGSGRGGCSALFAGIMMHGGLNMVARNNVVTGVEDTPFAGCEGVGIALYPNTEGVSATGEISHNTIVDYSKSGIVVNVDGAVAEIHHNTVMGVGPTAVIAQNGIQFGFGARGEASENDVSGNWYSACGDYLTCFNAAGILVVASNGVGVEENTLTDNQAGVNLFGASGIDIEENAISGSAWGIIVDSSMQIKVKENDIGAPTVMSNAVQVIGIWALNSDDVRVSRNSINFQGHVGAVDTLNGVRFDDSSGLIRGNSVRKVRMDGANFALRTGIGIAAAGIGDLRIDANVVKDYQLGGIFAGTPDSSLVGRVDIVNNDVRGVGPTHQIAQIGVFVSGASATGAVKGNSISDNCFVGPGGRDDHRFRRDNDDDDHEGGDDGDHHDDDHGKARCDGDFEVRKADRKTCPPPEVAFGLLLCNVPKDAVQVSKNRFKGNQVDFFRVRT